MKSLFLLASLVIQILKLRKELRKPGSDAVRWELNPMDFKLDWFVTEGSPSEDADATSVSRPQPSQVFTWDK